MPQMINVADLATPEERKKAKEAMKSVPQGLQKAIEPFWSVPPDEPGKFLGLRCTICNRVLLEGMPHWEGCACRHWHPFPPPEDE